MQRLSFAAAAVIGLLAAISPAFAEGGKMPRIISLSGHGEVRATQMVGYDVSNNVTVTLRKVDTLGALLDRMVQSGSNQISGISFDVSKPEDAMDEARKLATEDATRKAKVYAKAMGIELGNVMQVSEGSAAQPPMPMVRSTMMKA
ncbi:MAG: hypothetical protein CFE32_24215, partial [Alphaproteobacteria bacterium PA3]